MLALPVPIRLLSNFTKTIIIMNNMKIIIIIIIIILLLLSSKTVGTPKVAGTAARRRRPVCRCVTARHTRAAADVELQTTSPSNRPPSRHP